MTVIQGKNNLCILKFTREHSFVFMRNTSSLFMIAILWAAFQYCKSDGTQLPENDLQGKMEGTDWMYASANAFRLSTDGQYQILFLSDEEPVADPCFLPKPGRAHVKAIFAPGVGSFAVAPQALGKNQVQVAFELSNARSLVASSGFMEIFDFNGTTMLGYLQASEDVANTFVNGRFIIEFCD